MLGVAWLTLRQAREALEGGRLEEARRLLTEPSVQGHRKRGPLLAQLARAHVQRGEGHLNRDDVEAAWLDLLVAEQLQTGEKSCETLRQTLARWGLGEARALLHAGEPKRAAEALTRLQERNVRSPEQEVLDQAVGSWLAARELGEQGEWTPALEALARARRLLPESYPCLEKLWQELEQKQDSLVELLPRLHEALDQRHWRQVIELAGQVLAVAPQHGEARRARSLAWQAVEPATVAMRPNAAPPSLLTTPSAGVGPRFLLWIDGVGGYLICPGARLTLGQAGPDAAVDIPLVADISRLHATLTRDEEGYLLEGHRPIQVNGQAVTRALLRGGDRITLGTTCQLQFRQPAPLSLSGRLDLASGHRLPLSVDGVLLMADTLILGPGTQVHVTVPDLEQPLVLFRNKDALGLRFAGTLAVNGEQVRERCLLGAEATVVGDAISFTLESIASLR
jgi:tetratricopeptide (TPR) repeat protein